MIHGAMDSEEFPWAPLRHARDEAFVVGRISRAEPDKFARNLWQVYARVPHPLRVRVLGWGPAIEARLGPPPSWAECFPAGSLAPPGFLATLHAMVPLGGEAVENWAAYYTARLAYDEPHRLAIAQRARQCLLDELAEPAALAKAWRELFASLEDP
ncbi:MAG: hypothetical protein ABR915_09070 [Thermoguttaceae bacterium]